MNREQAIEAIKQGTHVLDIEGFKASLEAKVLLRELSNSNWIADFRFYGVGVDGRFNFLLDDEIEGRPIIKLSDILSLWKSEESTKETAISETKDMREYDEKLLKDFCEGWKQSVDLTLNRYMKQFLKERYPNKELEELLKQREELDKRIQELSK